MELGSFYMALTVTDIRASLEFYQRLGFTILDGKVEDNWLVLENGSTKLGLFQGMFERNLLTFHPPDVRGIQRQLKAVGIPFTQEADESTEGPTFATLQDPDGNPILLDQF